MSSLPRRYGCPGLHARSLWKRCSMASTTRSNVGGTGIRKARLSTPYQDRAAIGTTMSIVSAKFPRGRPPAAVCDRKMDREGIGSNEFCQPVRPFGARHGCHFGGSNVAHDRDRRCSLTDDAERAVICGVLECLPLASDSHGDTGFLADFCKTFVDAECLCSRSR